MPWYDKKWVIILAIIIFFPIGLVMMWRSPSFGTKTKVIVTAIFVLLIIVGKNQTTQNVATNQSAPESATTAPSPAPQKQYYAVDANTMMADLERNAAAAQKKYKGQLVAVTGRIGVIDSGGDYILIQSDNEFAITGIVCNASGKSQEDFILRVQRGQYVRAYGEIIDVGEVMGYVMKVDKFES